MDNIISLPSDLLSLILSDLPTKDAIRTSILSCRWRYLWTSTINVDICTPIVLGSPPAPPSLLNSIDRILQGANSSPIQKLRLHSLYKFNEERIASWIHEAVKRKVCHIDISVRDLKFPLSIFTCNTLTVLKLEGSICSHMVPESLCFPSLKVLHFLVNHAFNDWTQNLFRRCPVLEDLFIGGYQVAGPIYEVSSSSLRRLTFKVCDEYRWGPITELRLNTPNLKHFDLFVDIPLVDCSVKKLSTFSEVNLEITVCCHDLDHDYNNIGLIARAFKLLQGIQEGKSISLGAGAHSLLSFYRDDFGQLPLFGNLTHLEMKIPMYCDWVFVFQLLRHSPDLEALTIIKECCHFDAYLNHLVGYEVDDGKDDKFFDVEYFGESESCQEFGKEKDFHKRIESYIDLYGLHTPPKCLLSRLEICKIGGFLETFHALELIFYLLSNAQVLKKLIIEIRNIDPRQKIELCTKIMTIPKASSNCEVQFVGLLDGTSFDRLPRYKIKKVP